MSVWPSAKAGKVLRALLRIGWYVKRHGSTSHQVLGKSGESDYVWAFHDREELGPKMLARIAKHTRLKPEDL